MRDEVEEFLKRVAQMRAQAEAQAKAHQQQPTPQQQRAVPPQPPPPQRQEPRRLVPAREEIARLQPAEAEIVDAELAEKGDNVGRHVSQHLRGPQEIAEHTRHLGEEVDAADNKMAAHLHQVFDHQLGRLKKSASESAATPHEKPAPEVTAGGIGSLLRSPQSIRDAIVMSEILRRPEERW
jgi:hypothetical protein